MDMHNWSEPRVLATAGGRRRVALYSHDTVGLGHTRRNLALAGAIVDRHHDVDVIMITGNPEATMLPVPPRTDIVTLPTVAKAPSGAYRPRVAGSSLAEVVGWRRQLITGVLSAFRPDLMIVDKVPGGVEAELLPALDLLRRTGAHVVLGLREILDAPDVVRHEWQQTGAVELIKDYYDAVWVYGDPAVIDPAVEYGWPAEVARLVTHTGYLGRRPAGTVGSAPPRVVVPPPSEPYVLCQTGGGEDGYAVADAFARADLPAGHRGVLLTGPYLPAERRERIRRSAGPDTDVIGFVGNPEDFLAGAAAVVSMAGYNSVCELMGSAAPALLVPRVRPRTEQLIRATRLADLNCADLMHPDRLEPGAVSAWMADAVESQTPAGRDRLDLSGLDRVVDLACRQFEGADHAA